VGLGFGLVVFALRPLAIAPRRPGPADLLRAAEIVRGQSDPQANLVFAGDKAVLLSEDDAFLMYGIQGRSWVALGDPVGPPEAVSRLAWAFSDAAIAAGGRPVFHEVSEDWASLWLEMGLTMHRMGEEAVVDLARFDLTGTRRRRLRTTHARALRDGLSFTLLEPPHPTGRISELRAVSEAWLSDRRRQEKRFSVGAFDPGYLDRFPLAVVRHRGRPVGFANVLTTDDRACAAVDLMQHDPQAPPGVMELLLVELMLALKAQGYRAFSLGIAPLSGPEAGDAARSWARFGPALYRQGTLFGTAEGLRGFREKFDPTWRPRYIACQSTMPPVGTLRDVAALIAGGGRDAGPR
jgi:phosphatidylglycerol lysyltransferase